MGVRITVAMCDDEADCRKDIERMCKTFFREKKNEGFLIEKLDIQVYSSGKDLIESDNEFDILLLDIEMPEQDGISVKNYFERKRKQTRIIFLTSHKDRMLEAFGKNVVSFLLKPLHMDTFREVMDKTLLDLRGLILEVEENGEIFLLPVKQIKYIEAQDKYTLAVLETGNYLFRRTMKFWEDILPREDFARIHKSYLVHLEYFEKKGEEILLSDSKIIKISRLRKKEIMEKYKAFLRRKAKGV